MERRIITTEITEEDKYIEPSLRPQLLDEYIGQERIKSNLKVYMQAAKARGESLDHVLILWSGRDWGKPPCPELLPMRWAFI